MSTSDPLALRPRRFARGRRTTAYRYGSTRNFRGHRSFSARETVIDTSEITSAITARVAAGLGREKPACQF